MKLTPARHTALARLSDGEWHFTDASPSTAAWLYHNGLIRCNREDVTMHERLWTITPKGLAALKEAGSTQAFAPYSPHKKAPPEGEAV